MSSNTIHTGIRNKVLYYCNTTIRFGQQGQPITSVDQINRRHHHHQQQQQHCSTAPGNIGIVWWALACVCLSVCLSVCLFVCACAPSRSPIPLGTQCARVQVTPDKPPYPESPVAKDRVARGAGLVKWKAAKVLCVGAYAV